MFINEDYCQDTVVKYRKELWEEVKSFMKPRKNENSLPELQITEVLSPGTKF